MLEYCFEFKENELLIYEIDCKETDENGDCMDIQKGQVKWTLVKE
jgi:hypothetical protein